MSHQVVHFCDRCHRQIEDHGFLSYTQTVQLNRFSLPFARVEEGEIELCKECFDGIVAYMNEDVRYESDLS